MLRIFRIFVLVLPGLFPSFALAQFDVPAELQDRPPVAAPTDKIDVAPIQVVRSASEELDDFSAGLLGGAAPLAHVPGVALVVVRDDHIVVQRNFGALTPDTVFDAGTLSDLFLAVTAMHAIEEGKLAPDEDVSKPLGEASPRGVTVGQVLTHQAGNAELLAQLIEKTYGKPANDAIHETVFQPLAISRYIEQDNPDGFFIRASDIANLMIALVNDGAYQGNILLRPATAETMERTQFALHPMMPGTAYGFAEMHRRGWRALVHDGQSQGFQSRVVIVPEAKLGYVLVVQGRAGPAFWNAIDDALFDRAAMPRATADFGTSNMPAPSMTDARAVAGLYEINEDYAASLTALKRDGLRLRVGARDDGSLLLSGAENGILSPHTGGFWANESGSVSAAYTGERLAISTGDVTLVPLWKRPFLYVLLALGLALAGTAAFAYETRLGKRSWRNPSDLVLASASTCVSLLLLSAFIWFLSPSA